eukprot:gene4245-8441_t
MKVRNYKTLPCFRPIMIYLVLSSQFMHTIPFGQKMPRMQGGSSAWIRREKIITRKLDCALRRKTEGISAESSSGDWNPLLDYIASRENDKTSKIGAATLGATLCLFFTHDVQSIAACACMASAAASFDDIIGHSVRLAGSVAVDCAKGAMKIEKDLHVTEIIAKLLKDGKSVLKSLQSVNGDELPLVQPTSIPIDVSLLKGSATSLSATERIEQIMELERWVMEEKAVLMEYMKSKSTANNIQSEEREKAKAKLSQKTSSISSFFTQALNSVRSLDKLFEVKALSAVKIQAPQSQEVEHTLQPASILPERLDNERIHSLIGHRSADIVVAFPPPLCDEEEEIHRPSDLCSQQIIMETQILEMSPMEKEEVTGVSSSEVSQPHTVMMFADTDADALTEHTITMMTDIQPDITLKNVQVTSVSSSAAMEVETLSVGIQQPIVPSIIEESRTSQVEISTKISETLPHVGAVSSQCETVILTQEREDEASLSSEEADVTAPSKPTNAVGDELEVWRSWGADIDWGKIKLAGSVIYEELQKGTIFETDPDDEPEAMEAAAEPEPSVTSSSPLSGRTQSVRPLQYPSRTASPSTGHISVPRPPSMGSTDNEVADDTKMDLLPAPSQPLASLQKVLAQRKDTFPLLNEIRSPVTSPLSTTQSTTMASNDVLALKSRVASTAAQQMKTERARPLDLEKVVIQPPTAKVQPKTAVSVPALVSTDNDIAPSKKDWRKAAASWRSKQPDFPSSLMDTSAPPPLPRSLETVPFNFPTVSDDEVYPTESIEEIKKRVAQEWVLATVERARQAEQTKKTVSI